MAVIKSLQAINAGDNVERGESSCTLGGRVDSHSLNGESMEVPLETRNKACIDPEIPLLSIYPEENHNSKRRMHPNVY